MRRAFELGLPVAILVATFVLWTRNCAGPRLEARGVRLERNLARVQVRNDSRGEGQLAVTVRVRPRDGGPALAGATKVDIKAGEEIVVSVPVPGVMGDEAAEVEVEYPPR